MVPGLRAFMVAFLWFSFQQCHAQENHVLLWRLAGGSGNETLRHNQLVECESLDVLLFPETSLTPQSNISYYVLAFEPGGSATVSFVGYDPSALHWTVRHSTGTQLFLALLDSFGTSLAVHPIIYTVIPGAIDCEAKLGTPGFAEAKFTPPLFGRPISCGSWETSFSGTTLPNSVDIVVLEAGGVHSDFAPSGEYIFPYTNKRVITSDANGIVDTTDSIIHIADTKDTHTVSTLEAFSRCRSLEPISRLFRSREPPHPTTLRPFERLHMHLSRGLATISHGDTIAIAVCVSLGGTGIVAMVIYIVMMCRHRKKILGAHDTLPRPFELAVPAATTRTSVPTLMISPPRIYSQSGRRGTYAARREESLTVIKSHEASATPMPTTITSWPQPCSSHDTGTHILERPHLSDTLLLLNRAPSCHATPPHAWTRPHTPIPPDPQPHLGLRESNTSLPTAPQPLRPPVSRSVSVQERRSAKHALWLSRSASELYRTRNVLRHRAPVYDAYATSGGHTYDEARRVDRLSRPTNHLRQSHSATSVVHIQDVCLDSEQEEGVGTAIIFQHQDAGLMQELPPPYHKLVKSDAEGCDVAR